MSSFSASRDAINAIDGSSHLTGWFGSWPSFEGAEVISMAFDRGSQLKSAGTQGYSGPPSLTAVFRVVDSALTWDDQRSKPARVCLKFGDISELRMNGFGCQNLILALEVNVVYSEELNALKLSVKWGGAAGKGHDVTFLCGTCSVLAVGAA